MLCPLKQKEVEQEQRWRVAERLMCASVCEALSDKGTLRGGLHGVRKGAMGILEEECF